MDRTRLISINNEIAVHAKRKELTPAMNLFNEAVSEGIANSHTYAAVINANIRCGSLSGAEAVVKDMVASGRKKDVIICTTLMKGYCGEGLISKALGLLEEMSIRKIVPNIRTINTILRGCVQIGDIDNAELVINKASKDYKITLDVSSWEYMIVLYCQGLRLDKALPIVGRLKDDPAMASGIANMYLNVARAAALLGEWKTCKKALTAATTVLHTNTSIQEEETDDLELQEAVTSAAAAAAKKTVLGGKRAWKSGPGAEETDEVDTRRLQSLEMFREHSKEEMLTEIRIIEEFIMRRQKESVSPIQYMFPYYLRIFSFSNDIAVVAGEEDASSSNSSGDNSALTGTSKVLADMFEDIHNKFGLGPFVKKLTNQSVQTILAANSKSAETGAAVVAATSEGVKNAGKKGKQPDTKVPVLISTPDAVFAREQVISLQGRLSSMINDKGKLNFGSVFNNSSSVSPAPLLKMEICSGAGEWAVAQAKEDSGNNWVTLELRHDRVYQTLTKSLFSGASNMCILGGDAMRILPDRIESGAMDYLFVNHPEPPQQTGGLDSQGKHLLTTEFFLEANRILKKGGTFTIVTDNQWYGKFLMRQLGALISSTESKQQSKQQKSDASNFQLRSLQRGDIHASDEWTVHDSIPEGKVFLFVGRPGAKAGHVVEASSYFDRLWKKSKIMERYFIVLKKDASGSGSAVSGSVPAVAGHSNNSKSGKDFKHFKGDKGLQSGKGNQAPGKNKQSFSKKNDKRSPK